MPPKRFLVVRDTAPDGALRGAVVAMGNFDGVHRGHQAVIAAAEDRARGFGKPAAVLTFEPHPRVFFHPRRAAVSPDRREPQNCGCWRRPDSTAQSC